MLSLSGRLGVSHEAASHRVDVDVVKHKIMETCRKIEEAKPTAQQIAWRIERYAKLYPKKMAKLFKEDFVASAKINPAFKSYAEMSEDDILQEVLKATPQDWLDYATTNYNNIIKEIC